MSDFLRNQLGEVLAEALLKVYLDVPYEQSPFKQGVVIDCAPLADIVARELEADYVLVPKGHTHARIHAAREATNASDFQDDDDTECDTTWVAPGEVAKMMGAADE